MPGDLRHTTRVDTVKMIADRNCVNYIKAEALLDDEKRTSGNQTLRHIRPLNPTVLPYGVKSVELDIQNDSVVVEFSSKILKEKYPECINRNTVEEALTNLSCDAIQFNTIRLLENARCGRIDVTDDLRVTHDVPDYVAALSICGACNRFEIIPYSRESILFRNKAKSFHESISFYGKFEEIQNDPICEWIGSYIFRNVLRAEQRIISFRKIREKFKLPDGDPMFQDILESTYLHNFEMFQKLKMTIPDLVELYPEGISLNQIEKTEGRKRIVAMFDYDVNKLRAFLQWRVKGNIRAYLKIYKAIRTEMLSENAGLEPEHLISEIGKLLRAA